MIPSTARIPRVASRFGLLPNGHHRASSARLWLTVVTSAAAMLAGCAEPRYDEKTEREWLRTFRNGSVHERVWAAGALAAMGARSDGTRQMLVAALKDSSDAVAAAAAKAMAELDEARQHRETILSMLWRIASHPRSRGKDIALETLGLRPYRDARNIPVLVAALRDSSVGTRATAAVSLGMHGGLASPAVEALHHALRDTNSMVQHEIRDAIRAISGERLQH